MVFLFIWLFIFGLTFRHAGRSAGVADDGQVVHSRFLKLLVVVIIRKKQKVRHKVKVEVLFCCSLVVVVNEHSHFLDLHLHGQAADVALQVAPLRAWCELEKRERKRKKI